MANNSGNYLVPYQGEKKQDKHKVRCRNCNRQAYGNLVICPNCGRELHAASTRFIGWLLPLLLVGLFFAILLTRVQNPGQWARQQVDRGRDFLGQLATQIEPRVMVEVTPVSADTKVPQREAAMLESAPPVAVTGQIEAPAGDVPSDGQSGNQQVALAPTSASIEEPPTATETPPPSPTPTETPTALPTNTAIPTNRPRPTLKDIPAPAPTNTSVPTVAPTSVSSESISALIATAGDKDEGTVVRDQGQEIDSDSTESVDSAASRLTVSDILGQTDNSSDDGASGGESAPRDVRPSTKEKSDDVDGVSSAMSAGDSAGGDASTDTDASRSIAIQAFTSTPEATKRPTSSVSATDTPKSTEIPTSTHTPTPTKSAEPTDTQTPTDTPEPTAALEPTNTPAPKTYQVKSGDTLLVIAGQTNTSVRDIMALNNLTDEDVRRLRPGQVLFIPGTTDDGLTPALSTSDNETDTSENEREPQEYTVQVGDTILAIAQRFGITANAIGVANGMNADEAALIQIGQVLLIPASSDVSPRGDVIQSNTFPGTSSAYRLDAPEPRSPDDGTPMSCSRDDSLVWASVPYMGPEDQFILYMGFVNGYTDSGEPIITWVIELQRERERTSWQLESVYCSLAPQEFGRIWYWYVQVLDSSGTAVSPPSELSSFTWR